MTTYVTKDNDMLDDICWKQYGQKSGVVEIVLKANSGLAEYGCFLPVGLVITLPSIPKKPDKITIKLWE